MNHLHIFVWVIILLKRYFSVICIILFLFPITVYGLDCSATSAIVMDMETQNILYDKNVHEVRSMASTTKIMTALIACESGMLDETVDVKSEMLYTIGSCLGLRDGDKLSLYDLTVGMMLTSGNDAANTVAFYISGSVEDFAKEMNKRAEEIGMSNTVFSTPSGLDEGEHYSTAYDMALLTATAMRNSSFVEMCSLSKADIVINDSVLTVYNHNRLLNEMENCIGVKTGYTDKAGRCLVSAAEYEGNVIICVTLNAPDDWNDHKKLIDSCKDKYVNHVISDVIKLPVVGGDKAEVIASYDGSIITAGKIEDVSVYYFPFVYAPVYRGDIVGKVKIGDREVPITANEEVKFNGSEL